MDSCDGHVDDHLVGAEAGLTAALLASVEGAHGGPTFTKMSKADAIGHADHHVAPVRRVRDRGAGNLITWHLQVAQADGTPLVLGKVNGCSEARNSGRLLDVHPGQGW